MARGIIGVFGAGRLDKDDPLYSEARQCGRFIAEKGHIVLTGGLGGVMEAASRGAKEAHGITIGILPGDRYSTPANPYVDIPVYTGMGEARNVINVKSCNAAIAVAGEYGTLSEIALCLKTGCPLVLLSSWSFQPHASRIPPEAFALAESASDAVARALTMLRG